MARTLPLRMEAQPGLISPETELQTPGQAIAPIVARTPVVGPLLADVASPQMLNLGSDQPGLRTAPLQPAEVFRVAAPYEGKKPYGQFSAEYDANKPVSFFEGMPEGKAGLGPETIKRYDPNAPRRKGVKKRMSDAIVSPQVREGMLAMASAGLQHKDWYKTRPLYERYIQVLGEEKGKEKFVRDMQIFSATSAGASVQDNVRIASYYQHLMEQGLPLDMPPKGSGYGSILQKTQRDAVLEYMDTGEIDDIKRPKRKTFTSNLLGQEDYVTIDRHNMRTIAMLSQNPDFLKGTLVFEKEKDGARFKEMGFTISKTGGKKPKFKIEPKKEFEKGTMTMEQALANPTLWEDAPNDNEYMAYEQFQRDLAKELGISPAAFQAALWFGAAAQTGVESPAERMIDTVEKRVRYTAEQLGADPEMVFEQYIKGEIPLAQRQDMMQQYGGILG